MELPQSNMCTDKAEVVPSIFFIAPAGSVYNTVAGYLPGDTFIDVFNVVLEDHKKAVAESQMKVSFTQHEW